MSGIMVVLLLSAFVKEMQCVTIPTVSAKAPHIFHYMGSNAVFCSAESEGLSVTQNTFILCAPTIGSCLRKNEWLTYS